MEPSCKIDVKPFNYESGQDISTFLTRYCHEVDSKLPSDATAAQKQVAYLKHLPAKLDDFCIQLFEGSSNKTDWTALKAELILKLTDPAKSQQFQNKVDSIKWDGEMPLHIFENKVVESVRKLDPDIVSNDKLFKRDCYKRFLAGLPPDYRIYIDAGMPVRKQDLTLARERAEKFQELCANNEGTSPLASWCATGLPPPVHNPIASASAAFSAFKNNSIENINEQISMLSLAQKENLEAQKETNKQLGALIDQLASTSRNQPSSQARYRSPSPGRLQSNQAPNSPYRSSNQPYFDGRPRSPYRQLTQGPYYDGRSRSPYPPNQQSYAGPPNQQLRWGQPQQSYSGPPYQQSYSGPPNHQSYSGPPNHQSYSGPPNQQQWGPPPQSYSNQGYSNNRPPSPYRSQNQLPYGGNSNRPPSPYRPSGQQFHGNPNNSGQIQSGQNQNWSAGGANTNLKTVHDSGHQGTSRPPENDRRVAFNLPEERPTASSAEGMAAYHDPYDRDF